jgi:hypothetical protein
MNVEVLEWDRQQVVPLQQTERCGIRPNVAARKPDPRKVGRRFYSGI